MGDSVFTTTRARRASFKFGSVNFGWARRRKGIPIDLYSILIGFDK